MFQRKHKITTIEALKSGIIERYWNRSYKQYFYAVGDYSGYDGYDTPTQALDKYYELRKKREEIEIKEMLEKYGS